MNVKYTRYFIGCDNGTSGTIAIIGYSPERISLYNFKTPTKVQQNYTKKKSNITRVDGKVLMEVFRKYIPEGAQVNVLIERPLVNPKMFQATISAVRALEATLTIIETLGYSYAYIDSKEWQKALLPAGCKGPELKVASKEIGERKYPGRTIPKHPDADGLLIAHYCMMTNK